MKTYISLSFLALITCAVTAKPTPHKNLQTLTESQKQWLHHAMDASYGGPESEYALLMEARFEYTHNLKNLMQTENAQGYPVLTNLKNTYLAHKNANHICGRGRTVVMPSFGSALLFNPFTFTNPTTFTYVKSKKIRECHLGLENQWKEVQSQFEEYNFTDDTALLPAIKAVKEAKSHWDTTHQNFYEAITGKPYLKREIK